MVYSKMKKDQSVIKDLLLIFNKFNVINSIKNMQMDDCDFTKEPLDDTLLICHMPYQLLLLQSYAWGRFY